MKKLSANQQSGQVLITGIIMLIALLLLLLSIFDVHNLIRAKFKFETAQQSAAIAGANWQKESLNLIGEINILKACVTLLEGEKNWDIPLPPDNIHNREARKQAIQGRLDQLTEMQTRISFVGPMIGFGAAQQAAKANGMRTVKKRNSSEPHALTTYTNRLLMHHAAGKTGPINNYDWFFPYLDMVNRIANAGVAVLPNARGTGRPVVIPSELGSNAFYEALLKHKSEIQLIKKRGKRILNDQSSWLGIVYRMVRNCETWNDHILADTRYWEIDYNAGAFPNESEIFTLGVQTGFSDDRHWDYEPTFNGFVSDTQAEQNYKNSLVLPGEMKWFCYDDSWYPDYFAKKYTDYKTNHFDYWFGGTILRSKVKQKYHYEGAAAYAEASSVDVDRALKFRPERKYRKSKSSIISKRDPSAVTVGTKRGWQDYDSDNFETSYRPGAIAKTLGELTNEMPPITIPIVLPVFDKVVLMPTYMPIPIGFEVLRNLDSPLDDFLVWLADESVRSVYNYKQSPPDNAKVFLEALQELSKGKEFRFYAYNPETKYDIQKLYASVPGFLFSWSKSYNTYTYSENNTGGLGWLQEPRRCSDISTQGTAGKSVQCPDTINGGTATRYYVGKYEYYVVDAKGKVITNEDSDPTIRYTTHAPGCNCQNCCGDHIIPSSYNSQKGPPRI